MYECSKCGKTQVRLWRGYNDFSPELLCAKCAEAHEAKRHCSTPGWISPYKQGQGDQIGWHIPACPHPSPDSYWGYSSVPQESIDWWLSLPEEME